MMKREILLINVWGFEREELEEWPEELQPVAVTAWPVEAPVLVHTRAAAAFAAIAEENLLPGGNLMAAVLWDTGGELPGKGPLPPGPWLYFDEVVRPGDWEALRRTFTCPLWAQMDAAAFDLPARALAEAEAVASAGASGEWGCLPLAPEVVAHLREDTVCREAFRTALAARLALRASLSPLPAQAAREQHAPAGAVLPRAPLLHVLLRPWWRGRAAEVLDTLAATAPQLDMLTLIDRRLRESGLRLAGANTRRLPAQLPAHSRDDDSSLARLQRGKEVTWVQERREFALQYDETCGRLAIRSVRDEQGEAVEEFAVELAHDGVALWRGLSAGGEVLLSLAEFQEALEAGADQLLLWPAGSAGGA